MNKEYREGYESFKLNGGSYLNPYVPNTPQYNNYERGWTQALKTTPDYEFISGKYTPSGKHIETKAEKALRVKEEAKKKSMSDYLKAKG